MKHFSRDHKLPEQQNLATRFLDRKYADADFSDRYLQSSWSTLTGDMDPVITDKVLRCAAGSDFTPEDILCGREELIAGQPRTRPVTVYLRFPEHRLHSHEPLIRLIVSSLLDECLNLYDQPSLRRGRACIPSLWLFDEAGTSPIPSLKRFASTVAGREMTMVVMVQDINQLHSAYGQHDARSIMSNMQTQLFYEQGELDTLEYLKRRLETHSVFAHSKSIHQNHETVEGESEQAAPLMTLQEISELQTEVIGLQLGRKPFLIQRMDWRNYPHLAARTKIPAPSLPELPPTPEIPAFSDGKRGDFFDIDGDTEE